MSVSSPLTIERLPGKAPGTIILRLTGAVTLGSAHILRAELRNTDSPSHTILDLTGVPYVDSAGMSEIISHEIYCRDHKVRLSLAGVNPRVFGMFKITRLDEVLTIADTVAGAESLA